MEHTSDLESDEEGEEEEEEEEGKEKEEDPKESKGKQKKKVAFSEEVIVGTKDFKQLLKVSYALLC